MPEELTNADGQLVWQASYTTWGATVAEEWQVKTLANQEPIEQGDKPESEQNLRFQGQYLDRSTGLHYNTFRYYDYNTFRYYDADMGRFICPDPIGLQGGINLATYAPNPLSWIDPWGWAKCGSERKNRTPSPKNKNIDHSRTTKNSDGSTTYYDHKGNAVTYDKNGVPDFSPYAEKTARSSKYNGNRAHDNRIANEKINQGHLGDKAPEGKVWHHESKDKMILLDKDIHDTFPHTGSASVLIHG
ncbi:RHS repeat-associated core domain-containing protein [Lampropedia aestuarii]|uniref:RHS repeat-associated core domain-containing protein n=1 Tax=Lampropedia aestuarii TaxID=2562762 RepID=UPI001455FAD0